MSATSMDPLTLGLVLAALGMGGTLLTLFGLSLIIDLLKRLFPVEVPPPGSQPDPQPPAPPAPTGPEAER